MSSIQSVMHESRVFEPSPEWVAQANDQEGRLRGDVRCGRPRLRRLLGGSRAGDDRVAQAIHEGARRKQGAVLQVVRGRRDERLVQLPRPQPRERQRRQGRDHLRGGRRQGHARHVPRALSPRVPSRQRAQVARREAGAIASSSTCRCRSKASSAMQACARIGATHSVVFGGFSAKSLQERIVDAGAVAVITADEQVRGGKALPLKAIVDEALGMGGCEVVRNVVVYKRTGGNVGFNAPARRLDARARRSAGRDLRAGVGRRRASAVHPLHVGIDRQAEGRAAQLRRLPAVGGADDEVGVRHQAVGRLLVHGGHRLGDRPHVHHVRPARRAARPKSCSRACRRIRTPAASGR